MTITGRASLFLDDHRLFVGDAVLTERFVHCNASERVGDELRYVGERTWPATRLRAIKWHGHVERER